MSEVPLYSGGDRYVYSVRGSRARSTQCWAQCECVRSCASRGTTGLREMASQMVRVVRSIQGYLAHKKQPLPRTLQ